MFDSLVSIATDLVEFVFLDRLTTREGWTKTVLALLGLLTIGIGIWWLGRIMQWW